MRTLRGNQALNEALRQEMERDERVFVLGEDLARHGGVFRVTDGLLARFGPERVIDTPISESGIVGLAVGAAELGMRPVVEIQFTDLLTVAMDQIVHGAAKGRYAHDGALHAPLVIRTVNLGAGTIYSHQAFEAWFVHVPGLKVVAPATPHDLKGMLIEAIRDPDPVVFFEHRSLYALQGEVPEEPYTVPLGRAAVRRPGADATLVAWSHMVQLASEAAAAAAEEGIDVEVVDLRSLVPLDRAALVASVRKTGRLVIAEEGVRRGGFGAELAALVADSEAFAHLNAPIVRVANPGVPVPHAKALHRLALPGRDDILAALRHVTRYR